MDTVERYIAERRERIDGFVERHFSFAGTFALFRATFVKDIAKYPINFFLSIPSLVLKNVAEWLEMLGWDHAARLLQRVPIPLKTEFEASIERAVMRDLLELPEGAPELVQLQDPLKVFRSSRLAIVDAASSGLSLVLAYLVFGEGGLSPYAMGDKLARIQAKKDAASGFFLGSGVGSAFYSVFPPHPTTMQVFGATAMVLFTLGALGTLTHLVNDPLQRRAGVQKRQLAKLLSSFEDKLHLRARKAGSPSVTPSVVPTAPVVAATPEPAPTPARRPGERIAKLRALVARSLAPIVARYQRVEKHYGRRRTLQAIFIPAALVIAMGFVVAHQLRFDPYREAREMVAVEAFPTAVARLDELAKRGTYSKQADYWYWRGRALIGDHQYDAGAEAYRSAMQREAHYREDGTLIADLVTAVAKAGSARAKSLLLTENGPRAVPALVARTVAREKIDRWALAEIAERLGAHDRLDYEKMTLIDLEIATTCTEKKRAVQKAGEHHIAEATEPLHELEAQPQWKCLQPTLKNVLAELATR